MFDLQTELRNFFGRTAPVALRRLEPELFPALPAHLGTNLDFLMRVVGEGTDILSNQLPVFGTFRFNVEHVVALARHCARVERPLERSEIFGAGTVDVIQEIPTLIRAIATYHEEMVAAAFLQKAETRRARSEGYGGEEGFLIPRSPAGLLDLYPSAAGVVCYESDGLSPKHQAILSAFIRQDIASLCGRAWTDRLVTSGSFDVPCDLAQEEREIDAPLQRSAEILDGIVQVAGTLERVFENGHATPAGRLVDARHANSSLKLV